MFYNPKQVRTPKVYHTLFGPIGRKWLDTHGLEGRFRVKRSEDPKTGGASSGDLNAPEGAGGGNRSSTPRKPAQPPQPKQEEAPPEPQQEEQQPQPDISTWADLSEHRGVTPQGWDLEEMGEWHTPDEEEASEMMELDPEWDVSEDATDQYQILENPFSMTGPLDDDIRIEDDPNDNELDLDSDLTPEEEAELTRELDDEVGWNPDEGEINRWFDDVIEDVQDLIDPKEFEKSENNPEIQAIKERFADDEPAYAYVNFVIHMVGKVFLKEFGEEIVDNQEVMQSLRKVIAQWAFRKWDTRNEESEE